MAINPFRKRFNQVIHQGNKGLISEEAIAVVVVLVFVTNSPNYL